MLKVPCEMACFALREKVESQVGVYLASQFHYSGKARNVSSIIRELEYYLPIKDRQIRRGINWLIDRGWVQQAPKKWYFFKSIDRIHRLENWKFARATKMNPKDLKHIKEYLSASFFSSLIETGLWGVRTVPPNRRTETPKFPISLSTIQKILNRSEDNARILRNNAQKYNYISNEENLVKITSITPEMLKCLKHQGVENIKAQLFGYPVSEVLAVDRIRYREGSLFVQKPNLIKSNLKIKSRRGLNSNPYRDNNVA